MITNFTYIIFIYHSLQNFLFFADVVVTGTAVGVLSVNVVVVVAVMVVVIAFAVVVVGEGSI